MDGTYMCRRDTGIVQGICIYSLNLLDGIGRVAKDISFFLDFSE